MIWASADAGQVGHTDQQRLQLNQHRTPTIALQAASVIDGYVGRPAF